MKTQEIKFVNAIGTFAKRAGNNIVFSADSFTIIKKVMRRYFEMDYMDTIKTYEGKVIHVFSYHGTDDMKMVKEGCYKDWIIVDGIYDIYGDKLVMTELSKIPKDNCRYWI